MVKNGGMCVCVCVSNLTVCVYIERKKVCNIHLLVKACFSYTQTYSSRSSPFYKKSSFSAVDHFPHSLRAPRAAI